MKSSYRVLRQNSKVNLWNGITGAVGINMVIPFIGVMAAQMGATNTDYALISSIPALFTIIITLPAAFIIEQFRQQKKVASIILFLSRFCYLLLLFVPLLPSERMHTLIFLLGVYTAASSVANVAYQSIIGEVIPVSYRNRVMAQRNIWSGLFGMVVVIIAGWAIDRIGFPHGYQIVFAIGFVVSLFEIYYFLRFRIPSEETDDATVSTPLQRYKQTIRSLGKIGQINAGLPFYLYCVCSAIYLFAWQGVWPVYLKVKVDILHASNLWISIDTVCGALGALIGFRYFAQLADRKGNAMTVYISTLWLAVTPMLWIYDKSMLFISLYDIVGGFTTAGVTQSMMNRLLEIVPTHGRQRAIAVFTSLSQFSAIFAPLAGIRVYELLPYGWTMTIATIVRMLASGLFLLILAPRFIRLFAKHAK